MCGASPSGKANGFGLVERLTSPLAMLTGRVKLFNVSTGSGYIQRDDNAYDARVYMSDVEGSGLQYLENGQRVSFDLVVIDGELRAVNLRLLTTPRNQPSA
jgi:CspA family cold shock protein